MGWRLVLRRRVVVNLVTGNAVTGVLMRRTGPLLVLKDCTVLSPGAEPAPVDGDVVIERSKVEFVQAMPVGG